jgi:predicted N-formylglutamate amidohydrolase
MFHFLVTCEHGGNQIPERFAQWFDKATLATHKGWDIGILPIAQRFSEFFGFSLHYSEISRLLVELNRSLDNPGLFSEFTSQLSDATKKAILNEYYFPYREKVALEIEEAAKEGKKVIHLSFHSFTPVFNGDIRKTDIGLLFDPKRQLEEEFCHKWSDSLQADIAEFNIEFNSPYQGTDDGFTTYLRTIFSNYQYAGIEIEVNQKHLLVKNSMEKIFDLISSSFQEVKNQFYS